MFSSVYAFRGSLSRNAARPSRLRWRWVFAERGGGKSSSSAAVSKIERIVSQLKGQSGVKGNVMDESDGDSASANQRRSSAVDKYSDFFATPPAANSTAVLPGSFNQTFYNESKAAVKETNVSMLENRVEVEKTRNDLLGKLSGSKSSDSKSVDVSEGMKLEEIVETLRNFDNDDDEDAVLESIQALEDRRVDSSHDDGEGDDGGVPSLEEAYGDLPRWLIGPLLRFFSIDEFPDEESRELYEIASVLTLIDSMEEDEDLDFGQFQKTIIKRYQALGNQQNRASASTGGGSLASVSSASRGSDLFLSSKASTEEMQLECQALIESLDRLDIDVADKEELKTKLLSLLVKVDSALDAADSKVSEFPSSVLDPALFDETTSQEGNGEEDTDAEKEEEIATAIKNILSVQVEDDDVETSAERFVKSYFDPLSRQGLGISREGAGRFQQEVLTGLFVVNSVKTCDGAVIFEGQPSEKYKRGLFSETLREKVLESPVRDDVDYTLVMNEKLVNFDDGFERAALDVLLGSSPAVVIFPKTWNSTISVALDQPFTKGWQSFLSSAAVVSSGIFAGTCLNVFEVDGNFATTGELPADFLPLALAPVMIQLLASVTEAVVGGLRDVRVATLTIPTLTLFNFGSRAVYDSRPKDRNEMFDIALVGISTALLSSAALMVYGVVLTKNAGATALADYPTLPVSLLELNSVVNNIFSHQFPTLIANGDTSRIHLHWLAIAGAVSFIANSLQLLPLDNSAGSKLSYSVIGRDNFDVLNAVTSLIKFFVIFPMLFSLGNDNASVLTTAGVFSAQRLVVDYIIASQLATNSDVQIAVDNLEGVSEGRQIIFAGLVSLLLYCYFPFDGLQSGLDQLTGSGGAFQSLF